MSDAPHNIENTQKTDMEFSDEVAAQAFRRLVHHLRYRHDAENIDLMGLAGFCRNCLADWVMEADHSQGGNMTKDAARQAIYGMPYARWKEKYQGEATEEQIKIMQESIAKNEGSH